MEPRPITGHRNWATLGAANPMYLFLGPRETQLQKWGSRNNQNAPLMP